MKLTMDEFKNELKLLEQRNITGSIILMDKIEYPPAEVLNCLELDPKFKKKIENGLEYLLNIIGKVSIINKKSEEKKIEEKKLEEKRIEENKVKSENLETDVNDKNKKWWIYRCSNSD